MLQSDSRFLFVNGNIERLIQMTGGKNNNTYYAISEFFSDNMEGLSNDTYKIVADDNFNVFAFGDKNSTLIFKYDDKVTEPVAPLSMEDTNIVDVKETFLDLNSIPMPIANVKGKWLSVPVVSQGGQTYHCRAACMSSIMKYHGVNVSMEQIVSETKNNGTADHSKVQDYFRDYGFSSTVFNQGSLSFSAVKAEIDAERPLWQALGKSIGNGHAVVIEGYQYKGTHEYDAVSIMDPFDCRIVDCDYSNNSFEYNSYESHEGLYKIQ